MKKAVYSTLFIVGALALNPIHSYAQQAVETEAQKTERLAKEAAAKEAAQAAAPVETEAQKSERLAKEKKEAEELKAKQEAEAKKLADEKPVNSVLDLDDYSAHNFKLSFSGDRVQPVANLHTECANRIFKIEGKTEDPAEDHEDLALESKEDIENHAGKVGVRYGFHGMAKMKSLSDCEKEFMDSSDFTNLSSLKELGHSGLSDKAIARAGFIGDDGKIALNDDSPKSPRYMALEGLFKECKTCSVQKKLDKIKGLDLPWAAALMKKTLDEGLLSFEAKIDEARNHRDIVSLKKQLLDYAKMASKFSIARADKEDLMAKIESLIGSKLLAKDESFMQAEIASCVSDSSQSADSRYSVLARSASAAPSCDAVNQFVDFKSDTYYDLSKLPGIDAKGKKTYIQKSDDLLKGSPTRLSLIAGLDPTNSEVRAYLSSGQKLMAALDKNARQTCSPGVFDTPQKRADRYIPCEMAKARVAEEAQRLGQLNFKYQCVESQYRGQPQTQACSAGSNVMANNFSSGNSSGSSGNILWGGQNTLAGGSNGTSASNWNYQAVNNSNMYGGNSYMIQPGQQNGNGSNNTANLWNLNATQNVAIPAGNGTSFYNNSSASAPWTSNSSFSFNS